MKYINTKTGVVIEFSSKINGGDWEPVVAPKTTKEEKKTAPKKTKKVD